MELSKELAKAAYKALDDKLGQDITVLDIHEISVLADYFLIAHGNNGPQVQALIDSVDEALGEMGYPSNHIEGYREGNWVLIDFGRIIVHVFNKDTRFFYDLERIWADGKEISPEEL
ncbi:MAG: ribosome silencing factor [Lachnospiraceae bacterium]|nr:ribosome silencing factor [Lachnospiraceae bacterium]